ncbi:hypothetical protein NDU88_007135 [Pleurodeles waltl]|uniref:Uncharacterized protein n=1 Tax=Pleurodeles waltl TaxID=8319 RepID=A0AAV7PKY3_PLEWA|nr:hypothetical protein NDU88_007135 [Pleurodeles waltl]
MQLVDGRLTVNELQLGKIPEHDHDIWYRQQKKFDLDDGSRRDNIRITGLPEQFEKDDIKQFLTTMIPERMNLTFSHPQLEFQHVH